MILFLGPMKSLICLLTRSGTEIPLPVWENLYTSSHICRVIDESCMFIGKDLTDHHIAIHDRQYLIVKVRQQVETLG